MTGRVLLLLAAALSACGANKAPAASPPANAVVEIPEATQADLQRYDSDKRSPPAASARADDKHEAGASGDEPPHGEFAPPPPKWSSSGSKGGPDCMAAAACCELMVQQSGGGSSRSICDQFRHMPSSSCPQVHDILKRALAQRGVNCL